VNYQDNMDMLKKKASAHQLSKKKKPETKYLADPTGHYKCWLRVGQPEAGCTGPAGDTAQAVGDDSGWVAGKDSLGSGTGYS
jgi:hypothetical protein